MRRTSVILGLVLASLLPGSPALAKRVTEPPAEGPAAGPAAEKSSAPRTKRGADKAERR
jgi:hypothetical protein